ncbi:MAG: CHASE2 domain-containing protein [Cytophagales bacterium]|jgi:CHASE2 domain-containing sensor protein|nr:CHASE2 domain-containing protein [Cytophagales bacterium]MCE2895078.1 CHASE2 domain-containing protein [Flammeovirgaceae bacterium]MCA6366428.1 CHASE2 domain-containing protein [Cytophagales bacterium]MCA6373091.1 CHASE2 domain-containing protein [Cytophagales bacterium]MCA6375533.1 CHASE2 domain-containing protein [Cytophagales bacterium]
MKKVLIQSTQVTIFVFGMLWAVSLVSDLNIFSAFDTISQALKDTELTDYAFNKLRPDPTVDERIVLVNFGTLKRREVAQLLQNISQFKPRVIGMDALYNCEGGLRDSINCPQLLDTLGNLMLSSAIQDAGNVVLGSKLMQTDSLGRIDTNDMDSIEMSDPVFTNYVQTGFVNIPTDATYQEDVKISRTILPSRIVNGKKELAFSVRMAMMYDSVKTKKFLARGKDEEIINFRGNIEVRQLRINSLKNEETATTNFGTMFFVVDAEDVLTGNVSPELFKDKIVVMGYLGDYLGDDAWEDKFFTPLNKKLGGRANPDMFGPVVHSNVVAMILNEDYIDVLSDWQKILIAILVCFLTVALFMTIDEKLPIWYDALSVIIQLFFIAILMLVIIYMFADYNIKLELDLTITIIALVGPCYDIFKSVQNEINKQLTRRRQRVLNQESELA